MIFIPFFALGFFSMMSVMLLDSYFVLHSHAEPMEIIGGFI